MSNTPKLPLLPPSLQAVLEQSARTEVSLSSVISEIKAAGWSSNQIKLAGDWYQANYPHLITSTTKLSAFEKNFKTFILIFSPLFFVVLLSTIIVAFSIAYNKIPLTDLKLKHLISSFVFRLPLTQPTTEFLLNSTISSLQNLTKTSFDFRLNLTSPDLVTYLGENNPQIALVGYSDFSQKYSSDFFLEGSIFNTPALELRQIGKTLYFKTHQPPVGLTNLTPLADQKYSDTWMKVNLASLSNQNTAPQNDSTQIVIDHLLTDVFLPNIRIKTDNLNHIPTYRLELRLTPELLASVSNQLASLNSPNSGYLQSFISNLKSFTITVWVDKSKYLLQRSTFSFEFQPPSGQTYFQSPIFADVNLVLSGQNQSRPVEPPFSAIDFSSPSH
ncbi:MAG: hypothetical protein WC885_01840 [Candidatus Shapirobacteria bacterium]